MDIITKYLQKYKGIRWISTKLDHFADHFALL